jgi:hypothetical protein
LQLGPDRSHSLDSHVGVGGHCVSVVEREYDVQRRPSMNATTSRNISASCDRKTQ